MNPIPDRLMHIEVVFEPEELLAHRRGPAAPAPGFEPQPDRQGKLRPVSGAPADRHAPRCRPKEPPALRAMSAFRADQFEAEACGEKACFGPDLAAEPPTFRRLVAAPLKPSPSPKHQRRLASVK